MKTLNPNAILEIAITSGSTLKKGTNTMMKLSALCVSGLTLSAALFGFTLMSPQNPAQAQLAGDAVLLAGNYKVYGAIFDKWASLGAERGPLGDVTSNEANAANGGRYNEFKNGFIYWHPQLGAHAVYGLIGEKWNSLGRERSFGYPLNDESNAANGGRYNVFQNGGSIYWHPQTGAHAVYGLIAQKWRSLGAERGSLGYPISDELPAGTAGGRVSHFQHGSIYWAPGQNITVVPK